MYSNVVLIVLFIAVIVLGILVNRGPLLPPGDGYVDAGFCARTMPGNADCGRFYGPLMANSFFGQLSDSEKVTKLKEYIVVHKRLTTEEPATYPQKTVGEQLVDIEKEMGASKVTAAESSRQVARLGGLCPTSAAYNVDGKIVIQPSGMRFDTMADYTNYITAFYAKNTSCNPIPAVQPYGGPQSGVLGGLGTGTASADQVAGERNDRTVINQALQDLYDQWDANTSSKEPGTIPVRTFQFPAPGEQTYAKTPINSLDDYEYNRVFQLENRPRMSELPKQVKNNLLNAMQLDWPTLPYSSDERASLEEQFVDARMADESLIREPKSGVYFRNMDGVDVEPPDTDATAAREAKILSAYQPTDITKHVVDDEYERVAKVVAQQYSTDPDWEPVVEKRGPHQYAVTELRPRRKTNDKGEAETVWEDEVPTTVADAKQQGLLEGAEFTPTTMSIQDNLQDPYFAKTGVADYSNNRFWRYSDFNKWTPGLERMFAPTDPTNEWH